MIGELVGSYRIIKLLGAGAMGQVYLAEHRHLKRQAAIKVLARELVDRPDLLERFFMEARATSAIAHPGIVQIFDCEIDSVGRPYIVMELLTGETLAGAIARLGVLPPLSAARLARSLADALEAAHQKGIVHRDLKPENIFVQAEPPDTIKLVDFGIAKLAGEFQAQQMHKTRSGSVMGTPLYMSPEQCRDSANTDFRTDIYSLGCVLFEMLAGRPPFVRDNFGDLLVAHLTEPAPDVRTLAPEVPAPLAELTADLLRKEPSERPGSARQVAERLMIYVARMTTVPGAARSASTLPPASVGPSGTAPPVATSRSSPPVATSQSSPPVAASQSSPPVAASMPPVAVRTTFGGSASEVATDDELDKPPRRKGPIVAALVLLAGGAAAGVLALKSRPTAPGAVTVAAAPPPGVAPSAPPAPPEAPAPARAPAAHQAVHRQEPNAPDKQDKPDKRDAKPSKSATPPARTVATAGSRRGATSPPAAPSPSAPPSSAEDSSPTWPPASEERHPSPPAAATPSLAGTWEGPWIDGANNQRGRLYLQVAAGGSVAGWMYNTSAKLSFRMAGTMKRDGAFDLECQCAANQAFVARGNLSPDTDGDLKGDIALTAANGVFGRARVTLRRNASH